MHGWIKIPKVFTAEDLLEFNSHLDDIFSGKEKISGCDIDPNLSTQEKQKVFSRIHQLHLRHPLHEKFLLHPRLLDVIEQLCSPDVMALQTITTFFKEPGQVGQGYHQDSYYLNIRPDTLIGSWVALTPATKENGCLWLSDGSHVEPLYSGDGNVDTLHNAALEGAFRVYGASRFTEDENELFDVGKQYQEVAGTADPGDGVFFAGTLLHRSHANTSKTSSRRAFTSHYCDARVPWNSIDGHTDESSNHKNILARGDSHLPYAKPRFGMPVKVQERESKK